VSAGSWDFSTLPAQSTEELLEREADRVADQVMRTPPVGVSIESAPQQISRKCAACEDEDAIQRMPVVPRPVGGTGGGAVRDVLRSSGQPLDAATRSFFEPRLGYDFSTVRVHTDTAAAQSARDVNAHAYTVGKHLVFGAGQYEPRTDVGRRLIAHELVHVVQQTGSGERMMRKGFESTVQVCHRVLESRHFQVTSGGLRVVLLPKGLDRAVPGCRDFDYAVTLARSEDWWPDADIATCEATTGGASSFTFANVPPGTYYLTIWRNFDHPHCCLEGDLLVFDEPVSADSAGCARRKQLTAMEIVHGALDLAGFVPVLGAIPDGINAAIYVVEGDWANAGLSAVAMVPAWGDGVKLGAMAGRSAIRISEKAAIRLGEEGIARGLKEVKAASKAEKAAVETTGEVAKAAPGAEKGLAKDAAAAEKQEAKQVAKAEEKGATEAKQTEKAKEKSSKKGGKWTCYGRSAVLQIPSALPDHKCPLDGRYIDGPPMSAATEALACLAAKHAFNARMPRGCRPKHLDCRCSKR
jgi:hypothetical protein